MDEKELQEFLETLIEIEPLDRQGFLRVCECLTRIGVLSVSTNTLWQSCHILHKRGKYYLVHFKQLFALDGKLDGNEVGDEDLDRVERVAIMLEGWGLIKPVVELDHDAKAVLNVIPYKDKGKYNLRPKYTIGNKKKRHYERSEYNRETRGRPGDH